MSYLDPAVRASLEARLTTLREQLTAANAAYTASLGSADVQSYSFDSGEGKQAVTRRKPAEIRIEIQSLEREIAQVSQRLSGAGIVRMNLRRR